MGVNSKHAPNDATLPTRATEAMFPLAMLYFQKGEHELLVASKDLGNLLISRQKSAGYWVENESSQWHGCTIFLLVAMAATYQLLEKELTPHETKLWRAAIRRAADWVAAYQPVSHIGQAWVTVGEKFPLVRSLTGKSISKRFLNINYIATIPAALHYAWQVLGEDNYIERIPYFVKNVVEKATTDKLISGESAEVGPKLFKLARRTDSIDLGYNLDMTLGMLAIYADMTGDNKLLDWVHQHADAHLAFIYPDGSVDNGIGLRGYKSVYFGSETAHGLQMLCSVLRRFDAKYDRASKLNAALIAASMEDGVVQRGPFRKAHSSTGRSWYRNFTRATNIALAIAHYSAEPPLANTRLLCEETDRLKLFESINSAVVKKSRFMATVTGTRLHSSRLPYRFMTPPTGGSLSALYHADYGPIQLASPYHYQQVESDFMPTQAESESITGRIELVGTGYTNQHDTRVKLTTHNGSVTATGRLTRRLTLLRRNPYQITYEFENNCLRKRITVKNVRQSDRIRLVEPVVLTEAVIFTQLDNRVFTISTNSCTVAVEVITDNPALEIGLCPTINCHAPPIRAIPVEILLAGRGTITVTIQIHTERNAS